MIAPRVHMNGDTKGELQRTLIEAVHAIKQAQKALIETSPHARNYYVISDAAYTQARAEHVSRVTRLKDIEDELIAIYGAIEEDRITTNRVYACSKCKIVVEAYHDLFPLCLKCAF